MLLDKEYVKLYGCIIYGQEGVRYWKDDVFDYFRVGDYVIVQNLAGFSLAEIFSIVRCKKEDAKYYTQRNYESTKEIIGGIDLNIKLGLFETKKAELEAEKRTK